MEREQDPRPHDVSCPQCSSRLVYPVDQARAPRGTWEVLFRCGACGCFDRQVLDDEELEAFERKLDEATVEMVDAMQSLARTSELDAANLLRDGTW